PDRSGAGGECRDRRRKTRALRRSNRGDQGRASGRTSRGGDGNRNRAAKQPRVQNRVDPAVHRRRGGGGINSRRVIDHRKGPTARGPYHPNSPPNLRPPPPPTTP